MLTHRTWSIRLLVHCFVFNVIMWGFVKWLYSLFFWQMLPSMYGFMRVKSHMCSTRAHALHSRRMAWGVLPPNTCAACSAVTETYSPPPSPLSPFSFCVSFTLAFPLSLLYSCSPLPSVFPSPACLSFLLLALYIHDQLCVSSPALLLYCSHPQISVVPLWHELEMTLIQPLGASW